MGILVDYETDIKLGHWARPFSLLMAVVWLIFLLVVWWRSISRLNAIVSLTLILLLQILGTILINILTM